METPESIMRDALVLIAELAPPTSDVCNLSVAAIARAQACPNTLDDAEWIALAATLDMAADVSRIVCRDANLSADDLERKVRALAGLPEEQDSIGPDLRELLERHGFTADEIADAGPVSTALLERCRDILAARAGEKGEAA